MWRTCGRSPSRLGEGKHDAQHDQQHDYANQHQQHEGELPSRRPNFGVACRVTFLAGRAPTAHNDRRGLLDGRTRGEIPHLTVLPEFLADGE
jgi:hypothetical protein